jgi:hypothetical protein
MVATRNYCWQGSIGVRESWQLLAEHLLNFRPRMGVFRCNCEVSNANKTNETRSVRTGQGELANRRLQ